jgi:hypothetical protein
MQPKTNPNQHLATAAEATRTSIRRFSALARAQLRAPLRGNAHGDVPRHVVLGSARAAPLDLTGVDVSSWNSEAPELLLLGMAFTMTVPMVAWMHHRGHRWARSWEMTPAMFVPSFRRDRTAVG